MNRILACRELRARAPQTALSWFSSLNISRSVHGLPFATVEAEEISGSQPAEVLNLVQGKWKKTARWNTILDPLNGEPFIKVCEVDETGIQPFVESLSKCPKHGLHNPFKAPERYLMFGDISAKAAHMLSLPKVSDFFTRLIQRVAPKSYQQASGEVYVTQKFLENFAGDQVRFLARSFGVPGNHLGQQSHGFRWPYGPVAIVTPFNFPLEIPVLQLMGALYMGNKPILKVDSKVSIVMEQMMRLLHYCGLPIEDVEFINSDGKTMNKLLLEANTRMTLFTGSSRVAEKLALDLKGRVKLEDAGFDWKILGPDVQEEDYVAWVCDQDAYACSGQKCSAQSMLFIHENWSKTSLLSKMKDLAERRNLEDLTIGPVLTVTTETMLEHKNKLLQISGSKLLFGGEPLKNHSIPPIYGAIEPTAIYVPLEEILKGNNFDLVTREIFGPFQVVTDYRSDQLPLVLDAVERMHAHLTAAVVSNDPLFLQEVIGNSVNGTTYAGLRARTTGAPQNHWFGPAGDPRGAGIGTPEAIKLVWSCHREIIYDVAYHLSALAAAALRRKAPRFFRLARPSVSLSLFSVMSLLEVIAKASAKSQTQHVPSDYPIVLDPDSIFAKLTPKLDDPNPMSVAIPMSGWQISQTDSEIIELGKKFFTKLKKKLKNPNNFAKAEFLATLNPFLESIREKVGISIGVDSSNDAYTQILMKKVGSFMGKDVAGLVLDACVGLEIWELVGSLIANGLLPNACYQNLVPKVVAKRRSDLLCLCVKHASDLGSSELLLILKYFLDPPKDGYTSTVDVRKEWESQALSAAEKATDKTLSGKKLGIAKEAAVLLMVAYDGFSSAELCLHYLLASKNLDEVMLSAAISKLSGREMKSLLRYLGKWLKKYERFPQVGPCHKASTALGLKACDWVPKLEDVAKCIGVLLDENYSALVLHLEFHDELRSINEVVASLTLEARFCCSVASAADTLKAEV
ncbi:hypothetical protein GBA52_017558 [Prunus armeniaca]|nr:hypothetical protein GBA52_017558 [Prunus armeniaca]